MRYRLSHGTTSILIAVIPICYTKYLKYIFQLNTPIYCQLCIKRHVSTQKSHHQAIRRTISEIYKVRVHILVSQKVYMKNYTVNNLNQDNSIVTVTIHRDNSIVTVFTRIFFHVNLLGSQNVHWYFIYLRYGSTNSLMMTLLSRNMSLYA